MKLVCHGGKCCGVKHIHGMGYNPTNMCGAISKPIDGYLGPAGQMQPGLEFFVGEAPIETGIDRLDRYLAFLKRRTPGCLVEIVLDSLQKKQWNTIFLERGFKETFKYKNSNTNNMLYVYHRVMVKGEDDE